MLARSNVLRMDIALDYIHPHKMNGSVAKSGKCGRLKISFCRDPQVQILSLPLPRSCGIVMGRKDIEKWGILPLKKLPWGSAQSYKPLELVTPIEIRAGGPFAATDGIGEPSRLESGFPRGIPSSNLGRGVDVNKKFQTFISDWNNWFTRACSLVWLKRAAHNGEILGSNPSRPIGPLAYNLLCGVGSAKRHNR